MASLGWVKDLKRWRVRWRATNRTTHRVFSGSQVFMERPQALRCLMEVEAQEKQWRTGQIDSVDAISEALKDFESHCKQHTIRTQGLYRSVLARFVASLPKNVLRIQQLDAKHIQEYLYRLRDAGNINRTLNGHLTAVKSFCRYYSERYGLSNPAARVRMLKEDPPDVRFISKEEFNKLLAATKSELWRDRILFLAHTGLRISEFCALVRTGRLSQQASAVAVIGKGRRKRTVPLNRTCRQVLSRPHIYRPIGRHRVYMHLVKLARRAQIEPLGPHTLRHYCATQMLLRGVPVVKVAEVLGHSIRVCEGTYKHIIPQDLQGITDVLDE